MGSRGVAPCLAPGGPSSFRLRLESALLLGTSSPSGHPSRETFCGGCAWILALECHIARSKELRDSVRAEWRMEE